MVTLTVSVMVLTQLNPQSTTHQSTKNNGHPLTGVPILNLSNQQGAHNDITSSKVPGFEEWQADKVLSSNSIQTQKIYHKTILR